MATATANRVAIRDLDNDSLIIRLHFTINHLSRWLTPIHDPIRLVRTVRLGEPSAKDLLLAIRDEETRVFPLLHLISVTTNPDLDKLAPVGRDPREETRDGAASPLQVMAEFRRLRQSTCSLLRSLPDGAWKRIGISRREHDWSVRDLAEGLAAHDARLLRELDEALDRVGARDGIAPASRVHLDELLKLVPTGTRR